MLEDAADVAVADVRVSKRAVKAGLRDRRKATFPAFMLVPIGSLVLYAIVGASATKYESRGRWAKGLSAQYVEVDDVFGTIGCADDLYAWLREEWPQKQVPRRHHATNVQFASFISQRRNCSGEAWRDDWRCPAPTADCTKPPFNDTLCMQTTTYGALNTMGYLPLRHDRSFTKRLLQQLVFPCEHPAQESFTAAWSVNTDRSCTGAECDYCIHLPLRLLGNLNVSGLSPYLCGGGNGCGGGGGGGGSGGGNGSGGNGGGGGGSELNDLHVKYQAALPVLLKELDWIDEDTTAVTAAFHVLNEHVAGTLSMASISFKVLFADSGLVTATSRIFPLVDLTRYVVHPLVLLVLIALIMLLLHLTVRRTPTTRFPHVRSSSSCMSWPSVVRTTSGSIFVAGCCICCCWKKELRLPRTYCSCLLFGSPQWRWWLFRSRLAPY
jgi:uncharacterized membrane protein YgcG